MKYKLNENIRELRSLRGLNQVEFAKIMGVTKQCVSNWENDNVLPSIEMLMKIAKFFCISTDALLGISTNKTINAEGLTDEQIAHLTAIVSDFKKMNNEIYKIKNGKVCTLPFLFLRLFSSYPN